MSFRPINTASMMHNTISMIHAIPTGTLMPYAGTTAPRGWMLCDGRSLSKTQYQTLYRAIGDTYGSSSTEFNLPDMRGRVIVGVNNSHPLAEVGGAETHTLTVGEMPTHTHTGTTDASGAHTHTARDTGHTHTWNNGLEGDDSGNGGSNAEYTRIPGTITDAIAVGNANIVVDGVSAHTHTFTSQSSGNGHPHNNMQPYLSLHYIIRVV